MHLYRIAGALALGASLVAGASGVSAAAVAGHTAKAPTWVTTKGKTVNLTVTAAYNNVDSGFSFNGYGKGKMTITVPQGDKVNVTFSNDGAIPHSMEIVAFTKTPASISSPKDAFKGASSPNAMNGTTKGTTQKFSFTANKAGKYLLICAVPGHAAAGMWDNFVVSSSAKSASIKTSM